MRLTTGTPLIPFDLPAIDGTHFALDQVRGKPIMLSFFRFATCPFCNLRMHELVSRFDELGPAFGIVALFDSPLDHLREHAEGHEAPFPVLADPSRIVYRAYGIEHSKAGVLKGMLFRFPTLMKAMFGKGYFPTTMQGSITSMPADFLVDGDGIIRTAYYGSDEGDHLPFEQIKTFAHHPTAESS